MAGRSGGLRGATVADSTICFIDGEEGTLEYFGYPIQALAKHSTFEEVVFLLWNGHLPSESELAALDVPVPTSDPVVALATTAATAEDGDGDGNEDEAEAEPTSKKTGWWRR